MVDPTNGVDRIADVVLSSGKVGEVTGWAYRERDWTGLVVMPGVIDSHAHLSPRLGVAPGH